MNRQSREARLQADQRQLADLAADSEILDVESFGDPPDRYLLTFHGQGIAGVEPLRDDIQWTDEHRVELRMPFLYPDHPPDIRWESRLVHPNLSYSGFLRLEDIGLPWNERVGIEVVCERLWDVARLAFLDLQTAVNSTAAQWIRENEHREEPLPLPVDPRPLRKIELPGGRSNIVRYQRRGDRRVLGDPPAADEGLLVINDQTAPPRSGETPEAPAPPWRPPDLDSDDEDEVFYIRD